MARRPRFHFPSTIYHVMLRGNDGQPIFFSDADRCRMCLLIQEGSERFGHSIHAFCLMTNHIHLVIEVGDVSISRIMQNLAFRYTVYINKKYSRIGHLFQGRFKSVVVDAHRYLKELVRYIHLNPVRANLVNQPEQYPWSSHRAYLQLDEYTWLTRDKVLKKFGGKPDESISIFESYILNGIGVTSTLDFKSGHSDGILGDKEFVEEFCETVQGFQKREIQLSDLITKVCHYYDISDKGLRTVGKNRFESHIRAVLAFFSREIEDLSLQELSEFLGRDPSSLSKLANRLEKKCLSSPMLAAEIDELRRRIFNETPDPQFEQISECQA